MSSPVLTVMLLCLPETSLEFSVRNVVPQLYGARASGHLNIWFLFSGYSYDSYNY